MQTIDWEDTIVGPATPASQGYRSIIRISGVNLVDHLCHFLKTDLSEMQWRDKFKHPFAESVLFAFTSLEGRTLPIEMYGWPKGKSSTGQYVVELHFPFCGPLIEEAVSGIIQSGIRMARPGEFTLRSFLSGRLDLVQAEGVLGLIEAESIDQLKDAIDRRSGGLSQPIQTVRNDLFDLLADLEAGLDFADEDIEFVSNNETTDRLQTAKESLATILDQYKKRALRSNLPRVVLSGAPNAGKSSLLNAMSGDRKSIVNASSGTTRDDVISIVEHQGVQFELIDTAGIESVRFDKTGIESVRFDKTGIDTISSANTNSIQTETLVSIEQKAQERRLKVIRESDIVISCIPVNEEIDHHFDRIENENSCNITVRTKSDMITDSIHLGAQYVRPQPPNPNEKLEVENPEPLNKYPTAARPLPSGEANAPIAVSSLEHQGIEQLKDRIVECIEQLDRSESNWLSGRCQNCLEEAIESIAAGMEGLADVYRGTEWTATHLRSAIDSLGEMVGAVYTDDLLDRIFSKFCIGK